VCLAPAAALLLRLLHALLLTQQGTQILTCLVEDSSQMLPGLLPTGLPC
jgi:hypothetical protein